MPKKKTIPEEELMQTMEELPEQTGLETEPLDQPEILPQEGEQPETNINITF